MNIRYKLANWISGGALSKKDDFYDLWIGEYRKVNNLQEWLVKIHVATESGKSGTAKKVARMAREALK